MVILLCFKPSQVDRKEFDKARKEYWKQEYSQPKQTK